MKRIPVVYSKLTMPHLPDSVIISDRIRKLTTAMNKKNAVIITAPSGYGKTTLLISSLSSHKEKNSRICWYRMEPEDSDLSVFYTYLTEALFPREDPKWEETRQMLDSLADYQSQYRYINAIICQELWAYCNKHQNMKTFIVFDDFQQVKDTPEISESLAYIICNLPDACTVFISSRQQVDILSEKQKLEKSILEVNQIDLCFMEKEISAILMKTYQINVGKELMQKILNRTEGWIAGVIMVCRILSDSGTASESNLLEKPWHKIKLFSYMASEVLKIVDEDMLQFLIRAGVLKDFTIEEAEEILNINNVSQLVSQCEKKGLFIQKIVSDNITYRFHSLFRDALHQFQHEYITAEDIKNINFKAAAYYIEHKIFGRAIEHFIICGDLNSSVELITKEIVTLITFEDIEQLRVWFSILPEEVVSQNPSLLYIKSFTYQQSREGQMIPLMRKALAKFEEINDPLMQAFSLMTLIHYYMYMNDIDKLLDAISQALSIFNSINDVKIKYMPDVLLFMRAVYKEEFSKAIVLFKCLRNMEMDKDWKWVFQEHSCILGCLTGDLDYAESAILGGFENDLIKRGEFFHSLALTYYCTVLYLKNDTVSLASAENQLTAAAEKYEYNFMLGFGKRASAYSKYAMHDLEGAVELLETSSLHFEEYGNPVIIALNSLCKLLWLSRENNPKQLLEDAKQAYRSLSSAHSGFCLLEISQSLLGAIARECGDYKLGEEYLLTSIKSSEKKGAKQVLCGSYLHLAKLYFAIAEKVKAEDYLKKAFSLASSSKYSMFWDIHLPTLTEMSVRCIKSGIYVEYANELMEKYFKHKAVIYIEKNIAVVDYASIRDFSKKVLSKYNIEDSDDYSCNIDVKLFGIFSIAVNGTTIPDYEWKTKKIKGILEYLILHKGRATTRDQLMEVFWPDSEKKSAAVSLRAALYELKKVLVKYGIKNYEHSPFIHEKSGSLEIRLNDMLSIDTDALISLYSEYKKKLFEGVDKKQLLSILEKINSIYSEDLLCDEMYSDWTFADRESYRSVFLEVVSTLASLYQEEKEIKMAEKLYLKIMSIDSYNEEACYMLLKLYIAENQRSRAAKLYLDFERHLKKDLNIMPDAKLFHIVKNI